MSLQWYSPAEAAVADLVRGHSGITPTKWECFEALDRNRDGSFLDAADELLWKYAIECQQLDALSPTERAVADIVRAKTGDVPTQAECGFYLQLHNGNIQDAAKGVRNEYNRAQTRHEEQALRRAQPEQPARFYPSTGAMPFLDAFMSRESMPTPTVDLATERFRATAGIGEQMVRTEEDVGAVHDFILRSQLTSTDGASANLPSESTAPSLASASSHDPKLRKLVAAITSDDPVSPTKSGSEASDVDATGAVKKTSDGTPLCVIKNVEGSQALSTDEYLEIAWFAKGTTHSVNRPSFAPHVRVDADRRQRSLLTAHAHEASSLLLPWLSKERGAGYEGLPSSKAAKPRSRRNRCVFMPARQLTSTHVHICVASTYPAGVRARAVHARAI
jgi:hypothetical protein